MDQFIVGDAATYQTLVNAFKPPVLKAPQQESTTTPEILVTTRIRPILEDEAATGLVAGTFVRAVGKDAGPIGVVDIHELRKTVKGTAALNVGHKNARRAVCMLTP